METAIGVFTTPESAEQAVDSLLAEQIPRDAIVYLTRSQADANRVARRMDAAAGGALGGATGLTAGIAAATMLALPGIGQIFALGLGAAALLGLAGVGTGIAISSKGDRPGARESTASPEAAQDAEYFKKVLSENRSLVIVRLESPDVAAIACRILDKQGLGIKNIGSAKTSVTTKQVGDIAVIEIVGRIALAAGTAAIREAIQTLLERKEPRVVMDLHAVNFIDSAGLGELVRAHTSVAKHGGRLIILNPSNVVQDLFWMTKLDRVLEIQSDESPGTTSRSQASVN